MALWSQRAQSLYLASGTVGSRWPAFLGSSFYHAGLILVKFFSCDGKMGINGFRLMTPPAEQSHCKDICSFPQSSSRFLRFTLVKPCSHILLLNWRWEGEKRWEESEQWTPLPHHIHWEWGKYTSHWKTMGRRMLGKRLGLELSWCTEPSQLHVSFLFFFFPTSFNNHALSNPPFFT